MIIAIDFDGTCVTHDFPNVGKDINAVPVLKRLQNEGHLFVLNTMRSGEYLEFAVNWFKTNGLNLFGINENPTQSKWTSSPKVYAHIYIDDAALGCPLIYDKHDRPYVDWSKVEDYFFNSNSANLTANSQSIHTND